MEEPQPIQCPATREMPKYKCHKTVWALKIKSIEVDDYGAARISFEDESYASVKVTVKFMNRCQPQAGGYYVVYEDGYTSYSPAGAFEAGYTKI